MWKYIKGGLNRMNVIWTDLSFESKKMVKKVKLIEIHTIDWLT
jgi:hypothetical protein